MKIYASVIDYFLFDLYEYLVFAFVVNLATFMLMDVQLVCRLLLLSFL